MRALSTGSGRCRGTRCGLSDDDFPARLRPQFDGRSYKRLMAPQFRPWFRLSLSIPSTGTLERRKRHFLQSSRFRSPCGIAHPHRIPFTSYHLAIRNLSSSVPQVQAFGINYLPRTDAFATQFLGSRCARQSRAVPGGLCLRRRFEIARKPGLSASRPCPTDAEGPVDCGARHGTRRGAPLNVL